jgi:hypothetical protein
MKRLGWPILLLLAHCGPFVSLSQTSFSFGAAPVEIADSPNKKFRVVIESVPNMGADLQASMVKVEGDAPVTQWVTRISSVRRRFPARNAFVSDNGEFFVRATSPMGEIILFRKSDQTIIVPEDPRFGPRLFALESRMPAVDNLRGEEVLRLWDPDKHRWSAYRTKDGAKLHPSREDNLRWNEATRLEILEKLHVAKRRELQEKAMEIARPLARVAGPISTNVPAPTENDYLFLTTVRNPDDRKWFEELLEKNAPLPSYAMRFISAYDRLPYCFELSDPCRVQADWLLGVFDEKFPPVQTPDWFFDANPAVLPQRYALGKVTGTIRLPLPMPVYQNSTQATLLHIRLIRTEDAGKKTPTADEERIFGRVGYWRARDRREVYNVRFAFTTVLPGAYRLKAIWDKRFPQSDTNNAGPGDYETTLTAPFTVTAGATITNLLYCTNRIAGGEAYYAADEILERQWLAKDPAAPAQ